MSGLLRLDGANTTLLLLLRERGLPEIVHWGGKIPATGGEEDAGALLRDRAVPNNTLDEDVPEATLLPTLGAGSFGTPGLEAARGRVDWTADFTATARRDGDTLIIEGHDDVAKLRLRIAVTLPADGDVLTQRAALTNDGDGDLHVGHLAGGAVLLPAIATDLLAPDGHWAKEFVERRMTLPTGALLLENRRGRTSHDRFPALFAGTEGFGEQSGLVWAVHLGWSGNHRIVAERLDDGRLLIVAGELLHPGEVMLAPGETLETPALYAGWSYEGLGGISRAFHAHARRHVLQWPGSTMAPRPVTLNTWEGTYFAHDEARLMEQASAAAAMGIERFVLDDGWFPRRDNDRAGLGDWVVDAGKYPEGMGRLAHHVTGLGMQFGLWVEPEMVNPDSDLYRAHPDAVLHVAGRPLRTSRHQLVLDLTRPDIFARIHRQLDALLRELPIAYFKWDMNRDLVAAADCAGVAAYRRHVLATYALMDRLRADHPSLEIESCSSGGGRADFGVLTRTHRVWTSDCTDALERIGIQRGASRLLPPEILGAHISAAPNHQTGRTHSLDFRAAVALPFHFGIELDPLTLDDAERARVADWIALHKRLRKLLHGGAHVATDPEDGRAVRGVVAMDGSEAVFQIAQEAAVAHRRGPPTRLPGLDLLASYRVTAPKPQRPPPGRPTNLRAALFGQGVIVPGALLATTGLVLPDLRPEHAMILHAVRLA